MATKAWKCLKCSEMNDPTEEFRDVAANTCAKCKTWRYLYYALGAGGVGVLVALGLLVSTFLGMPARQYKQAFLRYWESDQKITEQERAELDKLAQKYRLDEQTIAKLESEVNPTSSITPASTKTNAPQPITTASAGSDLSGTAKRELTAILHDIYSDNVKTEVEQEALQKAIKDWGNQVAGLSDLEQQVREQCEKSRPYFEQGLFFIKQNKFPEALDAFERAIKVDGNNAWIRANMGSAYLRNSQPEQALLSFKQAIEFNPKNWLAHYNLGSFYAKQGQKDEAISELTQAIQLVVEDRNQRMTRSGLIRQLRTDAAFKPIQQDTRFQQLLAQN